MTREEIAYFLEIGTDAIDSLWASGKLQKTLHCPFRPFADLNYSTVYDVLEYALASGNLPVCLPKDVAALWVALLAEANEADDYEEARWQRQVELLLDMATEDRLAIITTGAAKVACVVVLAQAALADTFRLLDEAG
jgi:hypothetical protein